MDDRQTEEYRQRLLAERNRYGRRVARMAAEIEERGYALDEPNYDNHPADLATQTFELEKDQSLLGNNRLMVQEIDHALARLDSGEYGQCERCGRPIGADRLRAMPMTTLCHDCKREAEAHAAADMSPDPDLAALWPPFSRTFTDGKDTTAYDGEDAWQDVARVGTSNSPQDEGGAVDYEHTYWDADEQDGYVEEVEAMVDEHGEPILNEWSRRRGRPMD